MEKKRQDSNTSMPTVYQSSSILLFRKPQIDVRGGCVPGEM